MSYLKPRHLFIGLMGLSFVGVFVFPRGFPSSKVPNIELLFVPVSRPSRAISGWIHDKFSHDLSPDQRSSEAVKQENQALRNELTNLIARYNDLKIKNDERDKIDIRAYCTPFAVASTDSGSRQTLGIQGSSLQGLREKMYVIYAGGIVGQVQRAGVAGARVQLITDEGFRVRAKFMRFEGAKLYTLDAPQAVVEGTGRGTMQIRMMTREDVKKSQLRVGDVVVVDEPEWPTYLQGRHLGRVAVIGARADSALFAEITVEPPQNLLLLKEVMIVTKGPD